MGDYICQIEKGKDNPTNEEMLESIDNIDDRLWFIEHSDLFKMTIIAEAKKFFYGNRENIREDITHERNKKIKKDRRH